jgi:hypothetical protein
MSTAVICGLACAVLYLAVRWGGARAENAELRAQIEHLRRRLLRRNER